MRFHVTQPVTGPPDDYTDQLKRAAHEVLSMTDIVERLEKRAAMVTPWATCCGEAADEIMRLRADNAELQKQKDYWQKLAISRALEPKP
jgi:hypothetical protein